MSRTSSTSSSATSASANKRMFHVKQEIRRLVAGDEGALDVFLSAHADSSMFLRSNLRRVGLVDDGEPYQATYVAGFDGGTIVGVAGHCWNGMLLLQAPRLAE